MGGSSSKLPALLWPAVPGELVSCEAATCQDCARDPIGSCGVTAGVCMAADSALIPICRGLC